MSLRRCLAVTACLLPLAGGVARGQMMVQPAPQQMPPCLAEFAKLRDDVQKKASAIQKAGERKVPPKEACQLFKVFTAAEAKMLKYVTENATFCSIPPQVIEQIKTGHARSTEMRTRVCKVAEAPPRPAGPSLSDALTAPIPDSSNIKTDRGGTFDTLTGSPLSPK
jgi:hypothetical protein